MNFLQLVDRTRQECGVQGTITTTVSQTGEYKRLVDWVAQAYIDIQEEQPDWEWLRSPVSWDTTALKQQYSTTDIGINTTFARWKEDSFRQFQASAGISTQIQLNHEKSYTAFRDEFLFSSKTLVTGRPLYIAVAPDKSVMLWATPNDVYTVDAEYYKLPQILAADSDTPTMPTRFHMAIVYKAMESYGLFESAPELIQASQGKYNKALNQLRFEQMPMVMGSTSFI